ncbi:MAG TPA: cupredoxin domain-containing protein [Caulobacteraceae bacterium]|jgi:uncharacterized cupredoxin-like copper-binding protein
MRVSLTALSLGLALVAGAATAQPGPTVINVELSEYKYAPMQIELTHGVAYVFHVTNVGTKAHDLSARDFFKTVAFAPGAAAKLDDGDIDLERGDAVDVGLTPQTPGTYEMHCTHPFHAMLGMKGQIVVR